MVQEKWKPAFIAISTVLFVWCSFLIFQSGSAIGVFAMALLGMSLLLTARTRFESADTTEFGLQDITYQDHSTAELHELQRTLCKLEIDLENDISRLSQRYSDIKF